MNNPTNYLTGGYPFNDEGANRYYPPLAGEPAAGMPEHRPGQPVLMLGVYSPTVLADWEGGAICRAEPNLTIEEAQAVRRVLDADYRAVKVVKVIGVYGVTSYSVEATGVSDEAMVTMRAAYEGDPAAVQYNPARRTIRVTEFTALDDARELAEAWGRILQPGDA